MAADVVTTDETIDQDVPFSNILDTIRSSVSQVRFPGKCSHVYSHILDKVLEIWLAAKKHLVSVSCLVLIESCLPYIRDAVAVLEVSVLRDRRMSPWVVFRNYLWKLLLFRLKGPPLESEQRDMLDQRCTV